MVRLFILFLSLCTTIPSLAQIMVSRNYAIDLLSDTTRKNVAFDVRDVSMEGSHGFVSEADQMFWNIKFAALIELYKWQHASVSFSLFHELHASPFNQISFQPHTGIWNEMITYHYRLPAMDIQAGVMHRCRHNIDNRTPPKRGIDTLSVISSRIMVFNSIFVELQPRQWSFEKWDHRLSARAEYYLYTEDSRFPNNDRQLPDMENLLYSMQVTTLSTYNINKNVKVYSRNWVQLAGLSNDVLFNFRLESGIRFPGNGWNFEVFAGYEYFFDDMSWYLPTSSSVFNAGIRSRGKYFF